jgi:hypothetical protein
VPQEEEEEVRALHWCICGFRKSPSYRLSPQFSVLRRLNQLAAGLASFTCKLNTFRKRVKNAVTSMGIEVM